MLWLKIIKIVIQCNMLSAEHILYGSENLKKKLEWTIYRVILI